jgi:hypothetical protein
MVIDGAPYFQSWQRASNDTKLPKIQTYSGFLFEKTDGTLRLFGEDPRRTERATMTGWYLTADYTTMPPQVILSELPTKHSRWTFIPVNASPRNRRYYIKNERDGRKEAWLAVGEAGMLMNFGKGVANFRKPIISFGEPPPFDLNPYDPKEK